MHEIREYVCLSGPVQHLMKQWVHWMPCKRWSCRLRMSESQLAPFSAEINTTIPFEWKSFPLFFFFNIYQLLSAEVTERNIQRATSNKGQTESLSVNPGGGHLNASNSVWHPRANWRMEPYTLTIFFWCIPVWITWFFPDTHLSKDFLGVL